MIAISLLFGIAANAQTKKSEWQRREQSPRKKPPALDEAIKLATQQASDFRQAQLNEKIVKEDVTLESADSKNGF